MASFVTFLVASSLILLIMANNGEGGSLGVNFGRQASQKLLPSMVVDMCLANGITKVKLFSMNEGVISAFQKSDIQLIVAIPNVELAVMRTTEDGIKEWMDQKIVRHRKQYVDISYICVGVEPFEMIENDKGNTNFTKTVVPALNNMGRFINIPDNNLTGKVRLGVPSSIAILERITKPSQVDFRKDLKNTMLQILQLLNKTDSPFMINLYPYLSVTRQHLPLEFGLFEKQSSHTVIDGDLTYTNMFDVEYDAFVWALRNNGFGNMKIMVSQIGWPTDGGPGANVEMAKRFYDGLLKKVRLDEGTPLVSPAELDVYIYELADENQRNPRKRGPFERHYGIYRSDGRAKFNLDFTLQGRDVEPEPARGVMHLPQRWCIFNKEAKGAQDENLKKDQLDIACGADCTALNGSCSFLDDNWKLSYAFNMYFQMSNQEFKTGEAACDFEGLGKVVTEIPTFEGCDFPVQILSTLFINGQSDAEMAATLGKEKASNVGDGERPQLGYQLIVITALLWLVFFHKGRW